MKAERKQVFNEINITPLTDIFLVLLIIMMVVAPLLEYRQLNLSVLAATDSEDTPSTDDPKSVRVIVAQDGSLTVDGDPAAPTDLIEAIRGAMEEKPDGLIVETHPDAPFESMARVLDAAEVLQLKDVATVETDTTPAPEPEPAPQPAKKAKKKK